MAGYGVSKHVLEHYIELYADLFKLDYTILRYANVYGPRQDPLGEAGVVAIFTGKMLQGETPVIFGSGKQTRDFVYVGDVVRANVLALSSGSGQIFNIGTGVETSVNEILAAMKEITGFKGEAHYEEERLGEVFRIYLDVKKAKEELKWEPSVTFHEGLKKTVEYTKVHA
jgi:UDP-glucose 4-epimerase